MTETDQAFSGSHVDVCFCFKQSTSSEYELSCNKIKLNTPNNTFIKLVFLILL